MGHAWRQSGCDRRPDFHEHGGSRPVIFPGVWGWRCLGQFNLGSRRQSICYQRGWDDIDDEWFGWFLCFGNRLEFGLQPARMECERKWLLGKRRRGQHLLLASKLAAEI